MKDVLFPNLFGPRLGPRPPESKTCSKDESATTSFVRCTPSAVQVARGKRRLGNSNATGKPWQGHCRISPEWLQGGSAPQIERENLSAEPPPVSQGSKSPPLGAELTPSSRVTWSLGGHSRPHGWGCECPGEVWGPVASKQKNHQERTWDAFRESRTWFGAIGKGCQCGRL